jgi:predicted RND superfamily exporter protein
VRFDFNGRTERGQLFPQVMEMHGDSVGLRQCVGTVYVVEQNVLRDEPSLPPQQLFQDRHFVPRQTKRDPIDGSIACNRIEGHVARHTGTDDLPRKLDVMKVYDREQAAFPGGQIPAVVAIEAKDVTTPQIQAATQKMGERAFATGTMNGPLTVEVSADKHVASISIPMQGNGTDAASTQALAALRGGIVQSTVGSAPGVTGAYVTGTAAGTKDFNDLMKRNAPIVFAFVLSLAFLLLLVTFRSIVIPIKAIALNLLSVGAAYGLLTLIFQDGHLSGLLGFSPYGGIVTWMPLFLFVLLFGLSMDYHVFILSRIRELRLKHGWTQDEFAALSQQKAERAIEAGVFVRAPSTTPPPAPGSSATPARRTRRRSPSVAVRPTVPR